MSQGEKNTKTFSAEVKGIARKLSYAAKDQGLNLQTEMGEEESDDDGELKKELEAELFAEDDEEFKKKKKKESEELIVEEEAETGHIGCGDLMTYLNFTCGCFSFVIYFFFGLIAALAQLYTTYFVSVWADQPFEEQQKAYYPRTFGLAIIVYILLAFLRSLINFCITLRASKNMHNAMVDAVSRAPTLFYDSNPIGRMLTRFSKDITTLDSLLPAMLGLSTVGIFRSIAVFGIVCIMQPFLLIVIAIAVILMICVYRHVSQLIIQTQRMETIYRSPLNSGITNIVTGLISVRAYERMNHFRVRFFDDLEKSCNVTFTYNTSIKIMHVYLDAIAFSFTLAVSLFTLLYKMDPSKNSELSFALQIITDVVVFFSVSIRSVAEMENLFTSAQHIQKYIDVKCEDSLVKDMDFDVLGINGAAPVSDYDDTVQQLEKRDIVLAKHADKHWPLKGEIKFAGATMKYRENLEPSIKQLKFTVQPGMKVGIVGRTGAGKSSIL